MGEWKEGIDLALVVGWSYGVLCKSAAYSVRFFQFTASLFIFLYHCCILSTSATTDCLW